MQLSCIPLRALRNLRENNTQAYSIRTEEAPVSLADHAENLRQTTKQQTSINLTNLSFSAK